MEKLVATQRNYSGDIINFITSEGRVISYRKALMDVENGLIEGIQKVMDGNGKPYLVPENLDSFDELPNIF